MKKIFEKVIGIFKKPEKKRDFKTHVKDFLELTRAYSLPTSLAPWLLALCIAITSCTVYCPRINPLFYVLSFIAVVCIHLGVNLLDDYLDVKSQLKKGVKLNKVHFGQIKNKARLIIDGTYSLDSVVAIFSSLFAIALFIGMFFSANFGPTVILIALIALALCLFYPISTKYYLGEVSTAIIFGPLLMSGVMLTTRGVIADYLLLLSIPIGVFTAILLHTHSIMDYEYDIKHGKKTLATLFKSKNDALVMLSFLLILGYGLIGLYVYFGILSVNVLYAFLSLPLAIKLLLSLKEYVDIKNVDFKTNLLYGPMENFKKHIKDGNAFFMYRFYLARNLQLAVCAILCIICFIK